MAYPSAHALKLSEPSIAAMPDGTKLVSGYCEIECDTIKDYTRVTIWSCPDAFDTRDGATRYAANRAFAARIIRALAMLEAQELQATSHNG